jgi:single-strand DNA-binding protein
MSINTVVLSGRLGNDPSMKYTQNGTAVTEISIAIDRVQKGEKVTDWFPVKMFRELAERVNEYCRKGSLVGVEGRLTLEKWETQEGQKRSKAVIIANSVQFLSTKQEGQGNGQQSNQGRSQNGNGGGDRSGNSPPAGWGSSGGWGSDDLSVDEIPF